MSDATGRVGPESSVGKVAHAEIHIRTQELAVDLLGSDAVAWEGRALECPREVHRSWRGRANSIVGGTSEVNRTVLGERVLDLPREPDPHQEADWQDVPRS